MKVYSGIKGKVSRTFKVYSDKIEWFCEYCIDGKWVLSSTHVYTTSEVTKWGFTPLEDYMIFRIKRDSLVEVRECETKNGLRV